MKKGKAIYEPVGKAGEYAKYACNFYAGCSNDCVYCYCKRRVLGHAMGKPQATLKKCFADEKQALRIFQKELRENINELQQHGLFFTFTSDPMLPETQELTIKAVDYAITFGVPCKILTKRADFCIPRSWIRHNHLKCLIAFGFTLTGCDELEKGASTNEERINTMRNLHKLGFKTFASIEPIISLKKSAEMIERTLKFCNLYKIGLMSGRREYSKDDVFRWVADLHTMLAGFHFANNTQFPKVYFKNSVLEYIGETRDNFPLTSGNNSITVNADYNLFNANRRG